MRVAGASSGLGVSGARWPLLVFSVLAVGVFGCGEPDAIGPAAPGTADGSSAAVPVADPRPAVEETENRSPPVSQNPGERDYFAEVQAALEQSRSVRSVGSLSGPSVERLKAATVLVLAGRSSGSGFLFRAGESRAFILTNHHVVDSPPSSSNRRARVVLRGGTGREVIEEVGVLVADPEVDLAILEAPEDFPHQGVLRLAEESDLVETQGVLAVGYPFGTALGGGRYPTPTFVKGSIASLRRSAEGDLEAIQLDADLNPGMSGGPVLNARGEVIGISVSGIRETDISFLVPVEKVERMLSGSIGSIKAQTIGLAGRALGSFVFDLADPLGRVRRIGLDLAEVDVSGGAARAERRERRPLGEAVPSGRRATLRVEIPREGVHSNVSLTPWYVNDSGRHEMRPFFVSKEASQGYRLVFDAGAPVSGRPWVLDPSDRSVDWHLEADGDDRWMERVEVPRTEVEVPLPDVVTDLRVAGGGRYLVLRFGSASLGLFDLTSLQVEHRFPVWLDSSLFAAGGQRLVTYRPDTDLLEVFDLTTGTSVTSFSNPLPGEIGALVMGRSNGRTALVRSRTPGTGKWQWVLLDLQTLRTGALRVSESGCPARFHSWDVERSRAMASPDLSTLLSWERNGFLSPRLYELAGADATCRRDTDHVRGGELTLSDSGWIFMSGYQNAWIMSPQLKVIHELSRRTTVYPDTEGVFYLRRTRAHSRTSRVTLDSARTGEPLAEIELPEDWFPESVDRTELPLHRRLLLMSEIGALIAFPAKRPELVVRPFDLEQILMENAETFLVVTSRPPKRARPGSEYRYQIAARSASGGLSYVIESGPPDMRVDRWGRIVWEVPPGSLGEQPVVLRISDLDRNVVYQSFEIRLE